MCCFAAIEIRRAKSRDALQSCRELRLAESVAGTKEPAVVQENSPALGKALQFGALRGKLAGQFLAHRKTILSQTDGRLEDIGKLHGAVGLQRQFEAGHCSRHSHGAQANH